MARIAYETKRFRGDALDAIHTANQILEDYDQQGYDLTLRQLFYQHVARGLIPNTERSYKRLGKIVNDARMAGLIDWDHIVDRTRNVRSIAHWKDPAEIIDATARSFKVDLWATQENYVEVWIEKDALVGVIEGICRELDVPYFSCRGYTSQSEMWSASQRLLERVLEGKHVYVIHLGDHDPSGIDMTRDIDDRLSVFVASDYVRAKTEEDGVELDDDAASYINRRAKEALGLFTVDRIALTMAQVRQYNPPPNPAKVTDSRAAGYIRKYGNESWELDALDPPVMTQLIRDSVEALIEGIPWDEEIAREREGQRLLRQASTDWRRIVDTLDGDDSDEEEDDDE